MTKLDTAIPQEETKADLTAEEIGKAAADGFNKGLLTFSNQVSEYDLSINHVKMGDGEGTEIDPTDITLNDLH